MIDFRIDAWINAVFSAVWTVMWLIGLGECKRELGIKSASLTMLAFFMALSMAKDAVHFWRCHKKYGRF